MPAGSERSEFKWSPYNICEAWAEKRSYYTAKSGRLDVYRAAQEVLRHVTNGRILLALQPPTPPPDQGDYGASAVGAAAGGGNDVGGAGSGGVAELKAAVAALVGAHLAKQARQKKRKGKKGGHVSHVDESVDDIMAAFASLLVDFELDEGDDFGGSSDGEAAVPSWLVRAFHSLAAASRAGVGGAAGESFESTLFGWESFSTEGYDYDVVLCMVGELETVLPQTLLVQYNDLGAAVELHFAVGGSAAAGGGGGGEPANVVILEISVDSCKVQLKAA